MVVGIVIIAVASRSPWSPGGERTRRGRRMTRRRSPIRSLAHGAEAGWRRDLRRRPSRPGLPHAVEAARDAVLAVAEPVGTERIADGRCARPGHRRGRRSRRSRCRRGPTPRWTATRSSPPTRPAATEDAPDPARGHRRGPRRGRAGRHRRAAAPPSGSRPGARLPTAPMRSSRSRPRRRSTPHGRPGSRGRDATGPLPAACLVHEPVAAGGSVRAARQRPRPRAPRSSTPGTAHHRGRGRARRRARASRTSSVHRRPRVARPRHRRRGPGARRGPRARPASPTPTDRACARSSTAAGGEPIDLGIATDDLDDVLARLRRGLDAGADALIVSGGVSVGPYDVVKTAHRDDRPDRPVAGRGPARQAVRVRDGAAAGRRRARSCCSACRATRSRRP